MLSNGLLTENEDKEPEAEQPQPLPGVTPGVMPGSGVNKPSNHAASHSAAAAHLTRAESLAAQMTEQLRSANGETEAQQEPNFPRIYQFLARLFKMRDSPNSCNLNMLEPPDRKLMYHLMANLSKSIHNTALTKEYKKLMDQYSILDPGDVPPDGDSPAL
mmetsp:Transcript_17137/g.19110  ORF Transcript_17137/g.19110 Transcript_17137/m.19110 type:complete len:160 (+) Transcript_17137:424-903(+)